MKITGKHAGAMVGLVAVGFSWVGGAHWRPYDTAATRALAAAADVSVASDDLALLSRNWLCGAQQGGLSTVAYVGRFTFTGGAGDLRTGYQMRRGAPAAGQTGVAATCGRAPTKAQLGLS